MMKMEEEKRRRRQKGERRKEEKERRELSMRGRRKRRREFTRFGRTSFVVSSSEVGLTDCEDAQAGTYFGGQLGNGKATEGQDEPKNWGALVVIGGLSGPWGFPRGVPRGSLGGSFGGALGVLWATAGAAVLAN